jgi:hypothetical protein
MFLRRILIDQIFRLCVRNVILKALATGGSTAGLFSRKQSCAEGIAMKQSLFYVLVCLHFVVVGCASIREQTKAPLAIIQSLDKPARVSSSRHGVMEVLVTDITPADSGDQFFGRSLLAIQASSGGSLVAEHRFLTSYGLFRLEVIDLDADAEPEFVLISGEGNGTSVRKEWLEVFSIAEGPFRQLLPVDERPQFLHDRLGVGGGTFRQLLRTEFSGFFGGGARWQYQHAYRDIEGDRHVEMVLELEHTPIGAGAAEHPESIPAMGRQTFRFLPALHGTNAPPTGANFEGQPLHSETSRASAAAGSLR